MALTLCPWGHVATTAEILASMRGQHSIVDLYQASDYVVRPRRGLYACAHLREAELAALRGGGVLDCVSALAAAGADFADDGCLHVRFHAEGSHARARPELARQPVVPHWGEVRRERPSAGRNFSERMSRRAVLTRSRLVAEEAFRQALSCVPSTQLRGLIDGVTGPVLPLGEVRRIVSAAPRRTRERIVRATGMSFPTDSP